MFSLFGHLDIAFKNGKQPQKFSLSICIHCLRKKLCVVETNREKVEFCIASCAAQWDFDLTTAEHMRIDSNGAFVSTKSCPKSE